VRAGPGRPGSATLTDQAGEVGELPFLGAGVDDALRAIELVPWNAGTVWRTRYNTGVPDEDIPIRQLCFGPPGSGFVHYLILERQDTVELLEVFWSDL
jgi:hypothetical protein